jgi:hypothetical protein
VWVLVTTRFFDYADGASQVVLCKTRKDGGEKNVVAPALCLSLSGKGRGMPFGIKTCIQKDMPCDNIFLNVLGVEVFIYMQIQIIGILEGEGSLH